MKRRTNERPQTNRSFFGIAPEWRFVGLAAIFVACLTACSDDNGAGDDDGERSGNGTAACDGQEMLTWDGHVYPEAVSSSDPDECSPNIDYADSTHALVPGSGHSVMTVGVQWDVPGADHNATFSLTIGDPDKNGPDVTEDTYSLTIVGGDEGAEASIIIARITPDMGSCLSTAGSVTINTWAEPGELIEGSYEVTEWSGANCPTPPSIGMFRVRHFDP